MSWTGQEQWQDGSRYAWWLAELSWVWQQWVRGVPCGSHREADTWTVVPSPLSQIEHLIQLELGKQDSEDDHTEDSNTPPPDFLSHP